MSQRINTTLLMSGADYFDDGSAINAYMDASVPIDIVRAQEEHTQIKQALQAAGVTIIQVPPPADCQDGVYTANWGLIRGDKAVLARLPNARKGEEPYAEQVLHDMGKTVYTVPNELHFSGQGDALPCGNYLFAGSGYRTDAAAHAFLAETLGYQVITLQTVPKLDEQHQPVINAVSGWPDSFFYDIDLALSVLTPDLIAWCPDAFMPESQAKIQALPLTKIEVSLEEAVQGYACNLVSTGETVIMSAQAPVFQTAIEAQGLKTVPLQCNELPKGGGFIRCTTLTLDNN